MQFCYCNVYMYFQYQHTTIMLLLRPHDFIVPLSHQNAIKWYHAIEMPPHATRRYN
jgi:hypothetical protein